MISQVNFFRPTLLCLVAFLCFNVNGWGQCGAFTGAATTDTQTAPTIIGNSITASPPANNGGRRHFIVTNMVAGATYRISNCGSGFDTQLTVFTNDGNFTPLAYNDDNGPGCSIIAGPASIDFQPPSNGSYRIQLNRYNCSTSNQTSGNINVTLMANPPTSHCTPVIASSSATYINNFSTTGGATNISNLGSGFSTNGYQNNYPSMTVSQYATGSINFNLALVGGTTGVSIWVDWNNNNIFDLSERMYNFGGYTNGPINSNFTVPTGAALGDYRMRVKIDYNRTNPDPCTNGGTRAETEDYRFTVIAIPVCTTPVAQASTLNLTPTDVSITGSFTAAIPAPDNYLVVISESATPPTPVNGTNYTAGQTLGAYTVVDVDSNTNFTVSGLNPETLYYIYVFSFNSFCTGGPLYNTVSPLTGSTTTLAPSYCEPISDGPQYVYIDDVRFMGTLNDVDNYDSGYSNGYQDWTGLPNAVQAQGEGINIYYNNYSYNTSAYVKAWVDWNKDGDFNDAGELIYDTGTVSTSSASFGFVIPPATPAGEYRFRIRNNVSFDYYFYEVFPYNFDSCEDFEYTFWEDYDGEAEDYLFTVIENCAANIATISENERCGTGTVNLSVTGTAGTTSFNWYDSEVGGTLLATNSGNYTTPPISTTTTYYVTADNGSCESLVRVPVVATVNPLSSVVFTPGAAEVCGELSNVTVSASGDTETIVLVDEDFEAGGLGQFQNSNGPLNAAAYNNQTQWRNRTSTYIPTTNLVWFPAISSGFGANRFAMSTSDVNSPGTVYHFLQLTPANAMDATNVTGLTMTFDMYYSNFGDSVDVQANTGSGWDIVETYTESVGIGTRFAPQTVDLSAYDGSPNLRVRIRFLSNWGDGVAVDNIKVFGTQAVIPAFTWTSTPPVDAYLDAGFTTPYTAGTPAEVVYIRPTTAQLELNSFDISATVTLSNGCPTSESVTFTNTTKIWNGTTSDWNNPNNWLPIGVPTVDNCVIIRDNGINPDPIVLGPPVPPSPSYARNLTIKDNGNLELQPDTSLTVRDWVNVEPNGNFEIRNTASLVQVTEVAINENTGNANMYRTVGGVSAQDYVYWSSPTLGANVEDISPSTNASNIWQWQSTVGTNTNGYGQWTNASGPMALGEGYIVRGLSGTLSPSTARFRGVLNNGIINVPISKGTYTGADYPAAGSNATELDDNWNLIGNPYPSAISADAFITQNAAVIDDITGSAPISGTIYLWTHINAPSTSENDPFYQNFVYNYNADDYISYNLTGPNPDPSDFAGYIAAGQAFFVMMDNDPAVPVNANVQFNNSMREGSYRNDQFFRNTDENNSLEKHRIWLDLINSNNKATSTLIGYVEGATNGIDRLFDGNDLTASSLKFYSIVENKSMAIQGRGLPFNLNDVVPLGYHTPSDGTYTIAINNLDGFFATTDQNVYLEDTFTNTIHDLRSSPYQFTSGTGVFNERFLLRYTNTTLGIPEEIANAGLDIVAVNDYIKVTSGGTPISTVVIYDVLGRVLADYKNINTLEFKIELVNQSKGTLIVKATLDNGKQKVKKVVY